MHHHFPKVKKRLHNIIVFQRARVWSWQPSTTQTLATYIRPSLITLHGHFNTCITADNIQPLVIVIHTSSLLPVKPLLYFNCSVIAHCLTIDRGGVAIFLWLDQYFHFQNLWNGVKSFHWRCVEEMPCCCVQRKRLFFSIVCGVFLKEVNISSCVKAECVEI